jgi:hypothetical protein
VLTLRTREGGQTRELVDVIHADLFGEIQRLRRLVSWICTHAQHTHAYNKLVHYTQWDEK